MRIGELASATGVSVRSLRYYERQGLLRPARSGSGQRIFVTDDIGRVLLIVRLIAAGVGTVRILDLLPCLSAPPLQRTSYLLETLGREELRIGREIDSLSNTARRLRTVIEEVERESR
jgi:DNA-binding transcriptional MerR regulator